MLKINQLCSQADYYDKLRQKAFKAKKFIDVIKNPQDYNRAEKYYQDFLLEKVKCPTRANIAMQEALNIAPITNKEGYPLFKSFIELSPKIEELVNKVKEIENKQPKTLEIRKKLIEHNRFSLDEVKPKMSLLKKIFLFGKN